jgi:hypothetical protein
MSVGSTGFPGVKNALTYVVRGELPGFTIDALRDAASQAFALWAEETPIAFIRVRSQPDITITFRPLGTSSSQGNALIEINTSFSFRYGNVTSPSPLLASWDLVTVLAHEIGHKILGGPNQHSTDSDSILFETLSENKAVRTLPRVDIPAIRAVAGPPDIVDATAISGSTVQVERPSLIKDTRRRGPHTHVEAMNANGVWLHLSPATASRSHGQALRLHAVRLSVRTNARNELSRVFVWHGESLVQVHMLGLRGMDPRGSALWNLRLGVSRKPILKQGISVSLEANFANTGSTEMDIIDAGCDFVPANSIVEPPLDEFSTR